MNYHLLQTKPVFVDNVEQDGPPARRKSKQGEQKKMEKRKSQETAISGQSRKSGSSREALFLAADHVVPLDPMIITDCPGTPIKGPYWRVEIVPIKGPYWRC